MRHVTAIWTFRHFLLALVRLDLRLRYRRSVLGVGWSLISPIVMTAVFVLIFSNLLGADPRTYTKILVLGTAVWGFFRECAVGGCQALVSHESYIRQCPLPFGLYSLRLVLGQAIHSAIALGVALVAVVVVDGNTANLAVLPAVVPALVMLLLAGWAIATIFAFAQVYFHDTQHLLEIAAQLLFFLTPIVYPPEVLVNKGLRWMVAANPVNLFLELIRTPLATGAMPELDAYFKALAGTGLLIGLAATVTSSLQKKVIFHL